MQTSDTNDQRAVRLEKLAKLRELGIQPYPERYDTTSTCLGARALPDGAKVRIAGRLMLFRSFGKLNFGHLQDPSGRVQVSFQRGELDEATLKWVTKLTDIGDFLGIEGELWTTKAGERTVQARAVSFLGKSLRPLPEKWHGLHDTDARYRRRYLDLLMSEETRRVFHVRSRVVSLVRSYLDQNGFLEVETPMLQAAASGAAARPFATHHNALDVDLYLRISPETYLKRLVAGGMDRVYASGRSSRKDGLDPSHLQEFTMLEYYAAYWSYRDNMRFVREMIQTVVREALGTLKIQVSGNEIDLGGEWPERSYRELLLEDCGIDLAAHGDHRSLEAAIRQKGIDLEFKKYRSRAALIDGLYKVVSRPKLIQPMFLTGHPTELVPLARRSDADPGTLDMFQVLVNTWEIVKAYSELVDPIDQRARLEEQVAMREAGDDETMMMEEDFLECMEHGMPPISGLGLGIDRFVALITGQESLREVVFFPMMRATTDSG
ncbi:MAG: lysine--tRNA ligase [Planctomycetes bacterium]|nr:lysine--tRNA ligase [Planctomycetota bacterium]